MMRVYYLQDHDGHKKDQHYVIERTLARRLCNNGVAMPYQDYLKQEEERKAAEAQAKAEKAAKLAAERKTETTTRKKAVSKKASTRAKAVK